MVCIQIGIGAVKVEGQHYLLSVSDREIAASAATADRLRRRLQVVKRTGLLHDISIHEMLPIGLRATGNR